MDGTSLQDRIARGLGTAARAIGVTCDAYRPSGAGEPLTTRNRFLRLSAAFNPRDGSFRSAALPSQAMWYGVFDSAYLQPGDYLVERGTTRIWFVAALQNLLPAVCVLTNRVLNIRRPGAGLAAPAGVNAYGGGLLAAPLAVATPASLLHGGGGGGDQAIPADARRAGATVLLPPGAALYARGDIITDDLGRGYVVGHAEQNDFGWRLDVRQAAS